MASMDAGEKSVGQRMRSILYMRPRQEKVGVIRQHDRETRVFLSGHFWREAIYMIFKGVTTISRFEQVQRKAASGLVVGSFKDRVVHVDR